MTEPHTAEHLPSRDGAHLSEPRTRWAAIIWGTAFLLVAFAGFAGLMLPEARLMLAEHLATISRVSLAAYSLLAVGLLALTIGLVVVVRRAQRAATARRAGRAP